MQPFIPSGAGGERLTCVASIIEAMLAHSPPSISSSPTPSLHVRRMRPHGLPLRVRGSIAQDDCSRPLILGIRGVYSEASLPSHKDINQAASSPFSHLFNSTLVSYPRSFYDTTASPFGPFATTIRPPRILPTNDIRVHQADLFSQAG